MRLINLFIKRLIDIFASLIGIILLIPIWVIVPILIKIDSKGPVFFKQNRLTKNGKVFKMIKFRSMVVGAEKETTGLMNYENDARVTKVGKFLRTTSIDEFPQLFNVFIGNMSLIGPRPCVEYELGDYETLNATYRKRFSMKGGLTGLAQVSGRNAINWDDKVHLDNKYIDEFKKKGVFLDFVIIIKTVLKLFKRENIYEQQCSDDSVESAKIQAEEIIRKAHEEE